MGALIKNIKMGLEIEIRIIQEGEEL